MSGKAELESKADHVKLGLESKHASVIPHGQTAECVMHRVIYLKLGEGEKAIQKTGGMWFGRESKRISTKHASSDIIVLH